MTNKTLGVAGQAGIIVGTYITAEIVLVLAAYLWVYIYSIAIHSGGDHAYYEAYAQLSSPVVAVLLAGPVFFAAGRLIRKRWPEQAVKLAIAAGGLNILISLPLVLGSNLENATYHLIAVILATTAMISGGWLGAKPDKNPV